MEYNCRIIFRFYTLGDELEEAIVLINIGSHDEVYEQTIILTMADDPPSPLKLGVIHQAIAIHLSV